jgi:hypothetical protein
MIKNSYLYLCLLLIILSSSVSLSSAVIGGDNYNLIHINDCTELYISVTGEYMIDNDEYSLYNCNETINNTWVCNCSGDFDVILKTKHNTINNYTFHINYTYTQAYSVPSSSGGGGGGSSGSNDKSHYIYNDSIFKFDINPALKYVKPIIIPSKKIDIAYEDNITKDNITEDNITIVTNKSTEINENNDTESSHNTKFILYIIICILGISGLIIYYTIYKKHIKEKIKNIDDEYNALLKKIK